MAIVSEISTLATFTGGSDPAKGGSLIVVVFHIGADLGNEGADAREGIAADGALSNESEPAFYMIEP